MGWMFQDDGGVEADTSMMMELRAEIGEAVKSIEKICGPPGSNAERLMPASSSFKDAVDSAKELRESVAGTLSVMLTSDILLNKKHAGKGKAAMVQVMEFVGKKFGVTDADLGKIAPKLASQVSELMHGQAPPSKRKGGQARMEVARKPSRPGRAWTSNLRPSRRVASGSRRSRLSEHAACHLICQRFGEAVVAKSLFLSES